jgi:hypothetical protein
MRRPIDERELPDFAVRTSSTAIPIHQLDPTLVDHRLADAFLPTVMLSETMEHDIARLERSGIDLTAPAIELKPERPRSDDLAHLVATLLLVAVTGISAFFITSAIVTSTNDAVVTDR